MSASTLFPRGRPALYLAPMQDVTDLSFLRVLTGYGGADIYVTEYFRVHADSKPDPWILRSIDENPTGRPIFAQLIGRDAAALVRTARELSDHPVAGIDLNLGCPAPVVCRKDAGGGLLRDPAAIDRLLGALREAVPTRLTVKTRVGYDDPAEFEALLDCFAAHDIDALAIHGRTVRERYATPVHPECVRRAVERLVCPVIANGNVVDVPTGLAYARRTGAAGLMIGRGAIRNPWLFDQLRAAFRGRPGPVPRGRDLLDYIHRLYGEIAANTRKFDPRLHVRRMKKTMVYVTQGLDPDFEYRLRRVDSEADFFATCREFLDHDAPVPSRPTEHSRLFCGFSRLLENPIA
jgi:tRNA-dihydrouridine synthase C